MSDEHDDIKKAAQTPPKTIEQMKSTHPVKKKSPPLWSPPVPPKE